MLGSALSRHITKYLLLLVFTPTINPGTVSTLRRVRVYLSAKRQS